MSKIYVASSWRNLYQPDVVALLRMHNHEVYDFRNPSPHYGGFKWEDIGLEKSCSADEYIHAITTHPIAARGFLTDFRAMQWADTCVLVLPSGRSAHLEAGWFCGQGKRCIILTRSGEEPELMALLATTVVSSYDDLLEALK